MIILGCPNDIEKYYAVDDGELAIKLHKAGFSPKYKDEDGVLYFKLSKDLMVFLNKQ